MGLFSKGDRVEVTKWANRGQTYNGTVTNSDNDSVFVKYDNSFVEDELDHDDVRKPGLFG
jgi:hypothetical protein